MHCLAGWCWQEHKASIKEHSLLFLSHHLLARDCSLLAEANRKSTDSREAGMMDISGALRTVECSGVGVERGGDCPIGLSPRGYSASTDVASTWLAISTSEQQQWPINASTLSDATILHISEGTATHKASVYPHSRVTPTSPAGIFCNLGNKPVSSYYQQSLYRIKREQ